MEELEAEVQKLLARQVTSVKRRLVALAVVVVATPGLAMFLAWLLFSAFGGEREWSSLGGILGPLLAWFLYPFVAWRPFRPIYLLIALGLVVVAFAAALVLSALRAGGVDATGPLEMLVTFAIAAGTLFEVGTVIRNKEIRMLHVE